MRLHRLPVARFDRRPVAPLGAMSSPLSLRLHKSAALDRAWRITTTIAATVGGSAG
jgi:hypothetical protein